MSLATISDEELIKLCRAIGDADRGWRHACFYGDRSKLIQKLAGDKPTQAAADVHCAFVAFVDMLRAARALRDIISSAPAGAWLRRHPVFHLAESTLATTITAATLIAGMLGRPNCVTMLSANPPQVALGFDLPAPQDVQDWAHAQTATFFRESGRWFDQQPN